MFFKYKDYFTSDNIKISFNSKNKESDDNVDFAFLGLVDEYNYIFITSENFEKLLPQYELLEFQEVEELSVELKNSLRTQATALFRKNNLRKRIEEEVGDEFDLIADCMKLVEFNVMLTARLAADYFGTAAMDPTLKQEYALRNQAFLNKVDNNELLIRGAFEDVNEMLNRVMTRYSKIQELVRDEYVLRLTEIGL